VTKKKITILPVLKEEHSLVDTHCHLDMSAYEDDLKSVLDRAHSHGIKAVITIGIDLQSSQKAVKIAMRNQMVKATVGIHPHDVENITGKNLEEISTLIDRQKDNIVGYGEIGLDYVKKYSTPEQQRHYFKEQLALAKNHNLPVIIHDREAHDDIFNILKSFAPFDHGGVMHCFSGDLEYAKKVLDLGFHISIPGIVTFKNAHALHTVAQSIPLNSLLLETDGPFLAPEPYRGKRNEPLYTLYTADKVAKLRNSSIEEIADASTLNACTLFNFKITSEKNI
jgi:TatD DNase family protein